ncbi:MAG TPA: LysM domain-containing protein [Baekduia sp.]|nr:LysM domain-containing protein [Baekduia sp.]
MPSPSPARWLAPLSLAVCAVAVVAILGSGGSDPGPGTTEAPTRSSPRGATTTSTTKARRVGRDAPAGDRLPSTYVVKPGDSLSTIAERTGVSIEQLRERNPDVDAQALRVGQRLELGR